MFKDIDFAHARNLSMLKRSVNHTSVATAETLAMTDDARTVGQRIANLRNAKNLDQAPLAKAVGITVSGLSQIENGVTKSPKPETLFKIADALDVNPRWLVFGHHERVAPSLSGIRLTDTGRYRMRRKKDAPPSD
jgi:transcriptional regulator with XRE-family HTH domain